ncbi:MAG: hypothetical protein H8D55_02880 [Deltaproteobacteria bacterium]|nr:hypothetical protein [Deltaproteobacteria bacterium]
MLRSEYVLLGAVIFGAGLRLYQLPGQILFGDEWHAIFAATHFDYSQIVSNFGLSDRSIPITLYYKFAMNSVGLEEWVIRAPFFLSGTLTILVLPLLIRSLVGRFTSNLFAWLLAISPPLIFYSRFARPYSISLFCGFVAVIMFFRWWMAPNWRPAILYVILAAASAYLLLVTLPFVLGPFLFFLALSLHSPWIQLSHSIKRLTGLGILTLFPLLLLLAPPLYFSFEAVSNKASHSMVQLSVMAEAFKILTGQESLIIITITLMLAITGLIRMCRKSPSFTAYLFALSLIQAVTILILRPMGANAPHILARYMLLALPAMLIFVAAGVEAILAVFHSPLKKWVRIALPVGLCTLFFLEGPILAVNYRPNNATSLMMLVYALKGEKYHSILKRVPEFYKNIAIHPPASLTIVEAPFIWQANHIPLYQKIHRQHILMGLANGLCGKKEAILTSKHIANLSSIVDLNSIDELFDEGVNFVVFHKWLQNEVRVTLPAYRSQQDMSNCIERYRTRLGAPLFEDEDITVFEIS